MQNKRPTPIENKYCDINGRVVLANKITLEGR
jgi:hypothetical protein